MATGNKDVALYGPTGHLVQVERKGNAADALLKMLARSAFTSAESNRLNAKWTWTGEDINSVLARELKTLRARSRWLAMNNPYAISAINTILNYCVGTGFSLQMTVRKLRAGVAGLEIVEQTAWNDYVESIFGDWAEDCNFAGSRTSPDSFVDLQWVAFRRWLEDGEVFMRLRVDKSHDVVPLRLELVDADHIDASVTQYNGNPCFLGIEVDRNTWQPVAYWVLRTRGENPAYPSTMNSERVPADEMIHLFRRRYSQQLRGVPFLAGVTQKAWNIQDYEEAELLRNKLAACFSVLLTGGEGGGFFGDSSYDETAQTNTQGFPTDANGNVIAHIAPGMIGRLPQGYDVKTVTPTAPESSYEPFLTSQIMAMGAGLEGGISYTGLTRDTSKTTFAGGRMAENMDAQGWRPLMRTFAGKLLSPVTHRWLDLAVLSAAVTAPGYDVDPRYWRRHKWMPAGWTRGINPSQEMDAAQKSMDMGLSTLDDECAALGYDYQVQLAKAFKIAREKLIHIKALREAASALDLGDADVAMALGQKAAPQPAVQPQTEPEKVPA